MIFFGQASLQHAISQFMAHYQTERNHQGPENRLVEPGPILARASAPSQPAHRRQRLAKVEPIVSCACLYSIVRADSWLNPFLADRRLTSRELAA